MNVSRDQCRLNHKSEFPLSLKKKSKPWKESKDHFHLDNTARFDGQGDSFNLSQQNPTAVIDFVRSVPFVTSSPFRSLFKSTRWVMQGAGGGPCLALRLGAPLTTMPPLPHPLQLSLRQGCKCAELSYGLFRLVWQKKMVSSSSKRAVKSKLELGSEF